MSLGLPNVSVFQHYITPPTRTSALRPRVKPRNDPRITSLVDEITAMNMSETSPSRSRQDRRGAFEAHHPVHGRRAFDQRPDPYSVAKLARCAARRIHVDELDEVGMPLTLWVTRSDEIRKDKPRQHGRNQRRRLSQGAMALDPSMPGPSVLPENTPQDLPSGPGAIRRFHPKDPKSVGLEELNNLHGSHFAAKMRE